MADQPSDRYFVFRSTDRIPPSRPLPAGLAFLECSAAGGQHLKLVRRSFPLVRAARGHPFFLETVEKFSAATPISLFSVCCRDIPLGFAQRLLLCFSPFST